MISEAEGVTTSSRGKFTDPIPWLMLLLAISADQFTKWLVIQNLARGESWPTEGFFRFTHAWNTGTAFSLFQGQGGLLTWVSLGAVAVLAWIYRSIDSPPLILRIAFGLQLGGAIGNLTDRIRLGHVTDLINIGPWPIFNLADTAIMSGIGLMIYYFWFLDGKSDEKDEAGGAPHVGGPAKPALAMQGDAKATTATTAMQVSDPEPGFVEHGSTPHPIGQPDENSTRNT